MNSVKRAIKYNKTISKSPIRSNIANNYSNIKKEKVEEIKPKSSKSTKASPVMKQSREEIAKANNKTTSITNKVVNNKTPINKFDSNRIKLNNKKDETISTKEKENSNLFDMSELNIAAKKSNQVSNVLNNSNKVSSKKVKFKNDVNETENDDIEMMLEEIKSRSTKIESFYKNRESALEERIKQLVL